MKKLFSLDTIAQLTKQCARRFPITMGFIVMLTAYFLAMAWVEGDHLISERMDVTACYYLAVGMLLTAVLQLWGEEVANKRTRIITNIVAHITLLADSAYIYSIYGHNNMEVVLAHASIITALAICLFILPFFREKDDIASWNFTISLIYNWITSWIIGGIMCGGICLLTAAIEQLFSIDISSNWYSTWCILFLHTLPILMFIGRIPAGEEKHDRTPHVSTFHHKSIRFLFLPLLGCYLVVLYGYLARIIFEWQLPDGWVSKLVSVLTFGCIAVVLGLYPSLRQGTSKADNRITRFLPLAILPLLILMTVGIVRRLGDYGVTVNRLYLLTLNIWFYVVCIGLFLSRARRVWWIPASFAAFFLLTSVLPINISNFSHNWIYKRVETFIKDNYKGKLPMSEEAYFNWLAKLPREEAIEVNSRLEYLDWGLMDKTQHALVSDSISWWKASNYIKEDKKADTISTDFYYSSKSEDKGTEVKLDGQYSSMLVYTDVDYTFPRTKSRTLQVPIYKDKQPVDTLTISIADIRKWNALNTFTARSIPCRNKGNRFVLTRFSLQTMYNDKKLSFTYSGYYLIKK